MKRTMASFSISAAFLGLAAYLQVGLIVPAMAADIEPQIISIVTPQQPLTVKRYAAPGIGRRPAVLILHGRSGPAPKPAFAAAYARYATALADAGIDAYLISYFNERDGKDMLSEDEAFRASVRAQRYPTWISIVRDVASNVAKRPEASGRIGLLGFSLGGNLAAATAASDPSITALVVFYGGMPDTMSGRVSRLPPTLELHGDADKEAPLSDGRALVDTARALGVRAEQVVYPDARHGFDFDPARSDSKDAQNRAIAFLRQNLN